MFEINSFCLGYFKLPAVSVQLSAKNKFLIYLTHLNPPPKIMKNPVGPDEQA
jgi:hypothetical protein